MNLKGGKAYTVYVVGSRADRAGLQVLIPLEGVTYWTSESEKFMDFFSKTCTNGVSFVILLSIPIVKITINFSITE